MHKHIHIYVHTYIHKGIYIYTCTNICNSTCRTWPAQHLPRQLVAERFSQKSALQSCGIFKSVATQLFENLYVTAPGPSSPTRSWKNFSKVSYIAVWYIQISCEPTFWEFLCNGSCALFANSWLEEFLKSQLYSHLIVQISSELKVTTRSKNQYSRKIYRIL